MPSTHPPTEPAPRPSVGDQLKTAAASPYAPAIALITAVTGMIGAGWQAYEGTQTTARVSYETLKKASETNTLRIDACQQGLLEQGAWIQKLSDRIELRQVSTEKAVARKVTKPAAPPIAAAPVEPAPKAPPPPVVPEPTALPAFDKLAKVAP